MSMCKRCEECLKPLKGNFYKHICDKCYEKDNGPIYAHLDLKVRPIQRTNVIHVNFKR